MSAKTSTPFAWLKKIPPSLLELDEIPLLGHPPPFPWDNFQEKLAKDLDLPSLNVQPSELQWREEKDLLDGLGDTAPPLQITLHPFEGEAFWVMPEKDVHKLMALMLMEGNGSAQLLEEEYLGGFYHFLALEAMHAIEQVEFDPNFAPKLNTHATLPKSPMLTLDVAFTAQKQQLLGRLFITPELRKSLRGYYATSAQEAPFKTPLAEKLEVTVHMEAGSTAVTQEEWSKVKAGDFLLLDHCTLKPEGDKGHIMLTIGGHPLFRGEIQDGNIKIVEYPNYHEVK